MAVVTFMSYDGEQHEAPLEEGSSLMQVATNNAIPGIDADCGGEAACGTCHVVVDQDERATLIRDRASQLAADAGLHLVERDPRWFDMARRAIADRLDRVAVAAP